ncbi:hypothetical protein [Bradyrhizobium sp. USDA 3364]
MGQRTRLLGHRADFFQQSNDLINGQDRSGMHDLRLIYSGSTKTVLMLQNSNAEFCEFSTIVGLLDATEWHEHAKLATTPANDGPGGPPAEAVLVPDGIR